MSFFEMILKQSPWLMDARLITKDVHLNRLKAFPLIHHENLFLDYPFEDGVYIVTGPRQIGKSTHLKMFIQKNINKDNKENFLYFNCDLLEKKQDIVDVIETYLKRIPAKGRQFLLLDEITSVKDSFLAIKYLVDSGVDHNITYLLTGSNTISIKKTGEYLPGRRGKGIDFHFTPLSFRSFLRLSHPKINLDLTPTSSEKEWFALQESLNLNEMLETYLVTGGFPRVINEYYLNHKIHDDIFLIYRSWITSEIAKSDKKEYIAKRILERCLFSLARDVSYNAFAQDAGVGSHNTIYDYIEFFSSAYILSLIYQFDINQRRVNYRKNKKIYFNDPFIYAVIDAWLSGKPRQNFDYLSQAVPRSHLIENLVYLKLSESHEEVHYYKNHQEIDFISGDYLIEVKNKNKITSEDYKSLQKYTHKKIVVTKDLFETRDDILLIPIELFLTSKL